MRYICLTIRCYLCGRRFILPQELSRHIRDKVCKTNDDQRQQHSPHQQKQHSADAVDASVDSLSPMSLLQLPIITDISQDDDVVEVIGSKSEPCASLDRSPGHPDSLTADQPDVADASEKAGEATAEGGAAPVLWGCKQCDFR